MLKLKTEKLQEMVSKAVKGCSNNKMIPITSLMAIQLKSNTLSLITTDAVNYVYVEEDKVEGEDFYVVVQVDTFSKLIARMTCENVSMEITGAGNLLVKGNGKYTIDLPLDEEGKLIKFPDPLNSVDISTFKSADVKLSTIQLLLETNRAALAQTLDVPCYTGYYAGDKVVTTDSYKVCGTDIKLFESPILLRPEMMDVMTVFTHEDIKVFTNDDTIIFSSEDCTVYGKELEGIDDFQIDAINGLLDEEFDSTCKISKGEMLQVLDRISLFVGPYDKNAIYLTFTSNGIMISSKKSSGTEVVEYKSSENFKDFTCCIDIEMLKSQIKAHSVDMLEVHYGEDNAIKIVDANVTQIIALEIDDRVE